MSEPDLPPLSPGHAARIAGAFRYLRGETQGAEFDSIGGDRALLWLYHCGATYAIGKCAFGRAVLYRLWFPFSALGAENGNRRSSSTLLPQAKAQ